MSGPPLETYVQLGDFTELEAQFILEYMRVPAKYCGPIIIAVCLDLLLLGLVITQTWSYYSHYQDTLKFKVVVSSLFLVNVVQSVLAGVTIWQMFGSGFGRWEGLLENKTFQSVLITEAIAGALSQLFFLDRAFTLLRRHRPRLGWAFLCYCLPATFAGLGLGMTSGAMTIAKLDSGVEESVLDLLSSLIWAWKAMTVSTDTLLTATIIICLFLSRTGLRTTDTLIAQICRWTIEAQSLPLIAAVAFLAAFAHDPSANLCLVPSFLEAPLCCLSVLHVCNSRSRLTVEHTTTDFAQPTSSDFSVSTDRKFTTRQRTRRRSAAAGGDKREPATITISSVTHTRYSSGDGREEDLVTEEVEQTDSAPLPFLRSRVPSPVKSLEDEKAETSEDAEAEEGIRAEQGRVGRDLPDIDMIDLGRAPIGEIRTHRPRTSLDGGEEVVPFEKIRW